MSGAFQDITDEQEAKNIDLSENIAEDYIEYHRGNIVGHEQEGLLMYLGMVTGWAYDNGCHVNVIGQGPPGSGKSLTKNTIEELFDGADTYTKTSASSNAILDSEKWDYALIAPMDEYDKIDRDIIEVLKSSNPEDGGYSKDRNVEDPDARGGYSPTEVSADANPWVLLYAPSGKKGGIDDELEDRALLLHFSNDKNTRRGIMRKEFGHENIDSSDYDEEYIYDTQELSAALRQHIRNLPTRTEYEEEDGEEYLVSRTGDTLVYMPQWIVYVCEPVFNIDEDYTNRVFGIVHNLIRASALLNHEHRETKEMDIYLDEDSTDTETREAVVVHQQDVVNVLSCLPTLLSTTHQLTPLKRQILDAVDATEPLTDGDGTTVSDVQQYLDDNDIPHPSRSTLKNRMDDLDESYYLQAWENSGGKNGKATVYERDEQGALMPPRIHDLQRPADGDGIELATEDCVEIDPEDPFEDITDPVRDQPFKETHREFEERFTGQEVDNEGMLDQAMGTSLPDESGGGPQSSSTSYGSSKESSSVKTTPSGDTQASDSDSNSGQASLGDVSEDGVDSDSVDSQDDVELEPDGEPDNPTEVYVLEAMKEYDGEVFGSQHDVTHYIGAVGHDEHSAGADVDGTPIDPDHELWQNRLDMKDDRVINEPDALSELNSAYKALKHKGLVLEDDSSGPPAMHLLRVANTE